MITSSASPCPSAACLCTRRSRSVAAPRHPRRRSACTKHTRHEPNQPPAARKRNPCACQEDGPELGARQAEQLLVVGDDHDGTFELLHRRRKRPNRLQICSERARKSRASGLAKGRFTEVVGGLVEHEDVRLGRADPGKLHASLLAAGEHRDGVRRELPRDAERANPVATPRTTQPTRRRASAGCAGRGAGRAPLAAGLDVIAPVAEVEQALHLLERRFRELELVDVVLREHGDAQLGLAADEAVGRLELLHQQLQQRGLASTVAAHNPNPAQQTEQQSRQRRADLCQYAETIVRTCRRC